MRSLLTRFVLTLFVASGAGLVIATPANANCGPGTGTIGDPYLISTESQLRGITACQPTSSTRYYELTGNIRLTSNFTPLNLSSRGVHLDGKNFEISNFNIDVAAGSAGLFVNSSAAGSIKNLVVTGNEIRSAETSTNSSAAVFLTSSSQPWTIDNVHAVVNNIVGTAQPSGIAGNLTGSGTTVSNSTLRVNGAITAISATRTMAAGVSYLQGTISNVHIRANLNGGASTQSSLLMGGFSSLTINSAGATRILDSSFTGELIGNGLSGTFMGGAIGEHQAVTSTNLSQILRTSVRADISGGKAMGGFIGKVNESNGTVDVEIADSKFVGELNSSVANLNPRMAGVVGHFADYNPGAETINLSRNLISARFMGTGTVNYGTLYTESPFSTPVSSMQLVDNVYDTTKIAESDYAPGVLQNNQSNVADLLPLTKAQLQDSANYPASFNIRSAATEPDLGTNPRVDVWGMCTYADAAALSAAEAAGYETYAFLLTEQRRCSALPTIAMDVYPTQTAVVGTPVTPVYPNGTVVTEGAGIRISSYSVSPQLPAGLSIHPMTGKLSGTPLAVDGMLYTLTATNGVSTSSATFRLMLDQTAPSITTSIPANNAVAVAPNSTITLNFDEPVAVGAGKIKIFNSSDSSLVAEATVSSPQVSVSGSQLVFTPSASLPEATSFTIELESGAVQDSSSNLFAGLSAGTISFTTADLTAPTLTSSNPPAGGQASNALNQITLAFSEPVSLGTAQAGELALYLSSDDSLVEDFDINDANVVSLTGTILTLNLSVALIEGESYYLKVPSTALADASNNAFAGLAAGVLSFTIAAPQTSAPVYSGPLVLSVNPNPARPGDSVKIIGRGLGEVTAVHISGQRLVMSHGEDGVTITVPENMAAGIWDIVFEGPFGLLTVQSALTIRDSSVNSEGFSFWTKRIGDQVKIYAKNIVGIGKIQFTVDGEERAWVNAVDEADPKLREARGAHYLVRTIDLVPGKNAFEIYLENVRVLRTAYTLKR